MKERLLGVLAISIGLAAFAPVTGRAAQNMTYTYDAAGRLTSVTYDDSLKTTYTYDASGNVLSVETMPATSDAPDAPGDGALPAVFALGPGSPNPFRHATVLRYQLPKASPARLDIFAVTGRRVRALVGGELPAGYHSASWDGLDDKGHPVSSGIYLARFRAGSFEESRRISVLR